MSGFEMAGPVVSPDTPGTVLVKASIALVEIVFKNLFFLQYLPAAAIAWYVLPRLPLLQ